MIAFQVRVGRNVTTLRQGGAALRRAGLLFVVSCCSIGFTAGLPSWAALLLLAAAIAVLSAGELNHAAGTFTLDFGLAPAHAQGQYQGLAGLGLGAGGAAAPTLMIGLCLTFGTGRLGRARRVLRRSSGSPRPAIARRGERTRPADQVETLHLTESTNYR